MNHEHLLISLCSELVTSFVPDRVTPTTHVEDFLKKKEKKLLPGDDVFLGQVFYGIERYGELIKATLESLYHLRAAKTLRTDYTLYQIFSYLVIIRLSQDLSFPQFRLLVLAQDPTKMLVFLQFLYDDDIMNTVLREVWSSLFDHIYVEQNLLKSMRSHSGDMNELISFLNSAVSGNQNSTATLDVEITRRPSTVPKPFNLSMPLPHNLPEPIAIPRVVKANPVPSEIYNTSLEMIEEMKRKRKEDIYNKTREKLSKASAFILNTDSRPMNLEKVRQQVRQEEEKACENTVKAKPLPIFDKIEPVKLNAAAILREDALYKKKMSKEASTLLAYEAGLHDSSEYDQWKEMVKLADEKQRLAEIERRRLEMVASAQAAKEASENKREENAAVAQVMKVEAVKSKAEREAAIIAEKEANTIRAASLRKENEEALLLKKSQIAELVTSKREEVVKQSEEMLKKKKKEMEIELEKKRELIKRIQVMEREANALAKKPKEFDSSRPVGLGLLDEMSMDELHERIEILASEREEELRLRSEKIAAAKIEKESALERKLQGISRIRALAGEQASQRKSETRQSTAKTIDLINTTREIKVLEMQNKLETSKSEKVQNALKLASELKQIKIERQFLNADKDIMEKKKLIELEKGIERTLREKQDKTCNQATVDAQVQKDLRRLNLLNKYNELEAAKKNQLDYDIKVENLTELQKEEQRETLRRKKEQAAAISDYETQTVALNRTRNPYATKLSDTHLEKAKQKSNRNNEAALKLAKSIIGKTNVNSSQ